MRRVNFPANHHYRKKSGAALIGLLIVVAIIMVLYFIQFSTFSGDSDMTSILERELPPWMEEECIVEPGGPVKISKPPKPVIDEFITLTAPVVRDSDQRGIVTMTFAPDGHVECEWRCSYAQAERYYAYSVTAAGNIDVKKKYKHDGTTDESMLYFITRGKYIKGIYWDEQLTDPVKIEEGEAFITGYLDDDFSAHGKITLTSDRHSSVSYDWQREDQ